MQKEGFPVTSKYAVFLKVAELGSMSKAAMHCNYSQSAVSQIISSLEDELQMTLLNRSQSGVTLLPTASRCSPIFATCATRRRLWPSKPPDCTALK